MGPSYLAVFTRAISLTKDVGTNLAVAIEARHTARALREAASARRSGAREGRRRSVDRRAREQRERRLFSLAGVVDSLPVTAVYTSQGLVAHEELRRRATLLEQLGETVQPSDGVTLPATLHGTPIVVLLTLIRACDRVERCELEL